MSDAEAPTSPNPLEFVFPGRPNTDMDFLDVRLTDFCGLFSAHGFSPYGEGANSIAYYRVGRDMDLLIAIEDLEAEYPLFSPDERLSYLKQHHPVLLDPLDVVIRIHKAPGERQQADFRLGLKAISALTEVSTYALWAQLHNMGGS